MDTLKRPVVVLPHIHGDMFPLILSDFHVTADNGGQTRWDYYAAEEFCRNGYDVILINYGKFRGPGIRESFTTADGEILTPAEADAYSNAKITFLHVAGKNYGQDLNPEQTPDIYRELYAPLDQWYDPQNDLASYGEQIEGILAQKKQEASDAFVQRNWAIRTGTAKEKLWPHIPSMVEQVAMYLKDKGHFETLEQGNSLIYGGYGDAAYFMALLKEKLELKEEVLPICYVTHSVALSGKLLKGKEEIVLSPILDPNRSGLTIANNNIPLQPDFIEKSVECGFIPRHMVEESALNLATVVMATSPLHFEAYPWLTEKARQGMAVPGINQQTNKLWESHLSENIRLEKYRNLTSKDAAKAFLKDQGIPTDKPIIYAPARLQRIKGLDCVIASAAEANKLGDPVHVFITAGPRPPEEERDEKEQAYWDDLLGQADRLGVSLTLRPGSSMINLYMAAIGELGGLTMSSAKLEPFGMIPQEAIANGCPLIADRRAGCMTSGYLIDKITALASDYEKPEFNGTLIRKIIDDPDFAATLRANAYELALATTWEDTVSKSIKKTLEVRDMVRNGELPSIESTQHQARSRILGLAGWVSPETNATVAAWSPDLMEQIYAAKQAQRA